MCTSSPSPPPPPPAPPPPPPVLEQVAPEKAVPTESEAMNRRASGTKKYRNNLSISDSTSSTSGLGIAT